MRHATIVLAVLCLCGMAAQAVAQGSPATTPAPAKHWNPPKQCGNWADRNRPRGSNCFGLMPSRCGADKSLPFRGRTATRTLRTRIEAMAPAGVRWIAPGQAVTDDLRQDRLNVFLNRRGVILNMDCY